jgi:hypothetical protein
VTVLLLRIQLPDRPGSLGQIAGALGELGADIAAIEIVEKQPNGVALDDFMLELPREVMAEKLITQCEAIDGVHVLWLSRYPDNWGIQTDIEILDEIASHPADGSRVLVEAAPRVFHAQWAGCYRISDARLLHASENAPDLDLTQLGALEPLNRAHSADMGDNWLTGWGDVVVGVAPAGLDRVLVLGRQGGPAFLDSELLRLRHFSGIAAAGRSLA